MLKYVEDAVLQVFLFEQTLNYTRGTDTPASNDRMCISCSHSNQRMTKVNTPMPRWVYVLGWSHFVVSSQNLAKQTSATVSPAQHLSPLRMAIIHGSFGWETAFELVSPEPALIRWTAWEHWSMQFKCCCVSCSLGNAKQAQREALGSGGVACFTVIP